MSILVKGVNSDFIGAVILDVEVITNDHFHGHVITFIFDCFDGFDGDVAVDGDVLRRVVDDAADDVAADVDDAVDGVGVVCRSSYCCRCCC